MKIAPCKGCDRRKIGCHSTCEDYKGFREAVDQRNLARQKFLESKVPLAKEIVIKLKKQKNIRW